MVPKSIICILVVKCILLSECFGCCIILKRFALPLTHAHSLRKTQVEERVLNSRSMNEKQKNLRYGRNIEEKE